jgi:hypothetical protein
VNSFVFKNTNQKELTQNFPLINFGQSNFEPFNTIFHNNILTGFFEIVKVSTTTINLYLKDSISYEIQKELFDEIKTKLQFDLLVLYLLNKKYPPAIEIDRKIIADVHWNMLLKKEDMQFQVADLPSGFEFKQITDFDFEKLADFFEIVFCEEKIKNTAKYIDDFKKIILPKYCFVVVQNAKIISCCLFIDFSPDESYLFLSGTLKEFRDKMLFHILFQKSTAILAKKRYSLGAFETSKAFEIYKKMGFVEIAITTYVI